MKVKVTYFKKSGKYYDETEYESSLPDGSALYQYWEELRNSLKQGKRPGLGDGTNEFYVLVEVPEHVYEHPHLITPESLHLECRFRQEHDPGK